MRLIKAYGVRRSMVLFGAAAVAAQRGWESLEGPDGYTRQGVWTWKRDIEDAGIDLSKVEWSGFETRLGKDLGEGFTRGKENIRRKRAAASAKTARGRAST